MTDSVRIIVDKKGRIDLSSYFRPGTAVLVTQGDEHDAPRDLTIAPMLAQHHKTTDAPYVERYVKAHNVEFFDSQQETGE